MFYIGLSTAEESAARIKNRVRKGGHNIPEDAVYRRFSRRFENLIKIIPYCDEIHFCDNENGFVKTAEVKNGSFRFTNGYTPDWLCELSNLLKVA